MHSNNNTVEEIFMKTVFISGNENSGKTTTFTKLKQKLCAKKGHYEVDERILNEMEVSEANPHDYIILLKEKNKTSKERIILNYAADNKTVIEKFKKTLETWNEDKKISLNHLTVITAARNDGDDMRNELIKQLKRIYPEFMKKESFVEIPLARINGNSEKKLITWYLDAVIKLVLHILSKSPFDLLIEQ